MTLGWPQPGASTSGLFACGASYKNPSSLAHNLGSSCLQSLLFPGVFIPHPRRQALVLLQQLNKQLPPGPSLPSCCVIKTLLVGCVSNLSIHSVKPNPHLCITQLQIVFFLALRMRDLSSPTRDGTPSPAVEVQSPNHWTAREFPNRHLQIFLISLTYSHELNSAATQPLLVLLCAGLGTRLFHTHNLL